MQIRSFPDITLGWLALEALTLALPGEATRVARKCLWVMQVAPAITCSGKLTAGVWKDAFLLLIRVTMRPGIGPSWARESLQGWSSWEVSLCMSQGC